MSDEYVIRVTCDEEGSDETLILTPEQFDGIRLLAEAVERANTRCGPGIFFVRKNGEEFPI